MGGPRVPDDVRSSIVDIWLNFIRNHGYEPAAKEVLAEAKRIYQDKNLPITLLPKVRSIQEYIRIAHNRLFPPGKVTSIQQTPWTMATLDLLALPSESIPHLLKLWRYSFSLGAEFTIRQAKWASRLYTQEPDITKLWFACRRYSHEEELSIATDLPMRIFMLDSLLIMGRWERHTALTTDAYIRNDPIGFAKQALIPHGNDGGIAEELIHSLPFYHWINILSDEEYQRVHEINNLIVELPSSTLFFTDLETRMVYLRQLSYIAKGPKWNQLAPKDIRDIVVELREWIIEIKNSIDDSDSALRTSKSIGTYLRSQQLLNNFPKDLYIRVGYKEYLPKRRRK